MCADGAAESETLSIDRRDKPVIDQSTKFVGLQTTCSINADPATPVAPTTKTRFFAIV